MLYHQKASFKLSTRDDDRRLTSGMHVDWMSRVELHGIMSPIEYGSSKSCCVNVKGSSSTKLEFIQHADELYARCSVICTGSTQKKLTQGWDIGKSVRE